MLFHRLTPDDHAHVAAPRTCGGVDGVCMLGTLLRVPPGEMLDLGGEACAAVNARTVSA